MPKNSKKQVGSRKITKSKSKKTSKNSLNSSEEIRKYLEDDSIVEFGNNQFNQMMNQQMNPEMNSQQMMPNQMMPNQMMPNQMMQNQMMNMPQPISPSQVDPMLVNDVVPYDANEKERLIRGLENFKGSTSAPSMPPMSPSMGQQPMMGQPMMGQPMMGQPMMGQQPMGAPMSPNMGQMNFDNSSQLANGLANFM